MENEHNSYFGKAYRFITFEGLFNTIESESLRFIRTDKFNDPLDCSPFILPFEWEMYDTYAGEFFCQFVSTYGFNQIFKPLYICCFCKEYKTKDSYLMWSHYGESHSQVCFEIDFSVNKYLGGPSEVTYFENLIKAREYIEESNKHEKGLYAVTSKSSLWSYEKEVRLIVDIRSLSKESERFKLNDNAEYLFVEFDLKYITKVIFGINTSLTNELKTRNMFANKGFSPLFEKMYIDPKKLNLDSKPYNFQGIPSYLDIR